MRGTILGFDPTSSLGAITGFDGQRYTFTRMDWKSDRLPVQGAEVDYQVRGTEAHDIFVVQIPVPMLTWSKLFLSFEGRIGRQTYLVRFVLLALVAEAVIFGSLTGLALPDADGNMGGGAIVAGLLMLVFFVALFWVSLAAIVKRLHDRDHSGWFIFIGLIPMIGGLWLLIETWFLKGSEGPNRFGPGPMEFSKT